jgi:hypothetical protein
MITGMSRVYTLINCILISLLTNSLHARIAINGVRPVQIGERHYNITCTTAESANIVEWRRYSDGASVQVKRCFDSRFKIALGAVCSGGDAYPQRLYFGPITIDSAGVYSCIQRRFGITKLRNVTIHVIPATGECMTVIQTRRK